MKILHVTANMDPVMGGVCQAVRTMIAGLQALNIENEVASLDADNASYLKNDPFTVHTLGPGKTPWNYNERLLPWLVSNLEKYDAVILHGLWLYHGYALHKAHRQLKQKALTSKQSQQTLPKLFVMPHGMLDPYFQKAKTRKLKALRNILYWKLIENAVVNDADVLLFTCQEEMLLASQPFSPYKPKKEIVIGLGVDPAPPFVFEMQAAFLQKCNLVKGDSYFLFLSRIHEKKGVENLIEAYTALHDQLLLKSSDQQHIVNIPKLVIAGPNLDSAYGVKMQTLAYKNPAMRNMIFFPGMLSGPAKWGAFYGCEAFVLPSHQENFGIAIVEAMACKKPVLITNKVNIWREIGDAGAGMIEEDTLQGSHEMLSKWLQLSDEQKAATSTKAYTGFTTQFSVLSAAERMNQLLRSLSSA